MTPDFSICLDPPSAREISDAIDAAELRPEAVKAYRHPLGFVHIAFPSPDARKLRVHVWRDITDRHAAESSIHNHGFAFASKVLRGEIEHQSYSVVPESRNAPGPDLSLFEVLAEGSQTRLVATGRRVKAAALEPVRIVAGCDYGLPAGAFHRSWATGRAATITALACRKVPEVRSFVVSENGADAAEWSRQDLPTGTLLSLLIDVRRALHDMGGRE